MCAPIIENTLKGIGDVLGLGGSSSGSAAPQAAPAAPQVDPAEVERQRQAEEARQAEERAAAERAAEAERQRIAAEQRANRLSQGRTSIDDAFSPFNTSFYNNVSQSYNDFATDDLNKQYQSQLSGLISALTRSGGLSSAARTRGIDALKTQYDNAMGQIGSRGQTYSDNVASSVSNAKNALYGQNDTDPGVDTIASSASIKARELSSMPSFSPIAHLMIDPNAFVANRGGTLAAKAGGSASPALFSQNRQARGGGYNVV